MHLHVLELLDEVGRAGAHIVGVLGEKLRWQGPAGDDLELAAVRLQRTHRGHEHRRVGHHARVAALDVEETLGAHVGAEAGFGDEVLAAADTDEVADDGAVAVSDVAERASVHDDRSVLQRLQQVRLQGLAHDDGHRASTLELLGSDGFAGRVVADDDATHTSAQVVHRVGEREDGHHLTGGSDVEPGLAGDAVHLRAEADDDVAQCPVVDVEHSPPGDVVQVEIERVALVEVVVDHRRQQVVGRGHCMEVAGEVQVQQLHRDHLAVAATGGTALDTERRAHRGLTQADDGLLADVLHRLAKAHRGGGLPFAEWRRGDGRNHHVFGLRATAQLIDRFQTDLGHIVAMLFEQMRPDTHLCGNFGHRCCLAGTCDGEVGRK
ncbi:unannotated protein [freshwater metagenome]|uniref:Unannotated protein n=1 Tax=freshwater metagenome TaxID=449393 RepID=A0A6J7C852_9ZZZZ